PGVPRVCDPSRPKLSRRERPPRFPPPRDVAGPPNQRGRGLADRHFPRLPAGESGQDAVFPGAARNRRSRRSIAIRAGEATGRLRSRSDGDAKLIEVRAQLLVLLVGFVKLLAE